MPVPQGKIRTLEIAGCGTGPERSVAELSEADEQVPAEEEYVEGGGQREREKLGEFLQIAHGYGD